MKVLLFMLMFVPAINWALPVYEINQIPWINPPDYYEEWRNLEKVESQKKFSGPSR